MNQDFDQQFGVVPQTPRELLVSIHQNVQHLTQEFRDWRTTADNRMGQHEAYIGEARSSIQTISRDISDLRGDLSQYRLATDEYARKQSVNKSEFDAFLAEYRQEKAVLNDRVKILSRVLFAAWAIIGSIITALIITWITTGKI